MDKKIKCFEDLEIWQKATNVAVAIFKMSEKGKLSKDYGSRDQIRRAVFLFPIILLKGLNIIITQNF